jgi:hypothetical protein
MRFHFLRPGQLAPEQASYVHLDRLADGRCTWSGHAGSDPERISGSSRTIHHTVSEATSDAVSWARAHRIADLYIERDAD